MKLTEFLKHTIFLMRRKKAGSEAVPKPSEVKLPAITEEEMEEARVLEKAALSVPMESWRTASTVSDSDWVEASLGGNPPFYWRIRMSPRSVFYHTLYISHTTATAEQYRKIIAHLKDIRDAQLVDSRKKSLKDLCAYIDGHPAPSPIDAQQLKVRLSR